MNLRNVMQAAQAGSRTARRVLTRRLLAGSVSGHLSRLLVTGLSAAALAQTAIAGQPLLTQSHSFRIPFTVDASPGTPVSGYAILFSSVDGGPLEQTQRVSADVQGFQFTAPRDGRYAFAVQMTDAAGNLASSAGALIPELEVIVDSSAPRLQLQLIESAPGQVLIRWNSGESQISPGSLMLEYAEGNDGRWKPLQVNSTASGQTAITSYPGTVVSVRGSVTDLAGNRGEGSNQLVLSSPAVEEPRPPQPGTADPALPRTQPGNFAALNISPWAQPTETTVAPTPKVQPAPGAAATVNQAKPAAKTPPPVTAPAPAAAPVNRPAAALSAPQIAPFQSAAPSQPRGFVPVSQPADAVVPGSELVNSQTFEIAYEVDGVGPSGVGSVELFVTEDNGQQWFRYGNDTDLQSPFQVDVMGEGTFGFAIRVRNGLGFSDPPPQPGDLPEVVVSVDQTAPAIDFPMPQVQADRQGLVSMNWRVSDRGSASAAVRLESSTSAAGPWTPVFDWQQDPGHLDWPVKPGTPPSVYFRLLARDSAGNVASSQTPQAVLIDQQRPTARVVRVQPTSAPRVTY